ncbi:MAG: hypothetical protein U5K35_06325 [Rhodohalobacter sp.]|nr:hypothetical protein [Rhodohalobacter sp.]MDZ7756016.1 hypothetical protein [Rhodohalobacter sp.]
MSSRCYDIDALKGDREVTDIRIYTMRLPKREIASILRCDLSLIISSYEMKLLRDVFRVDDSLLIHLPFMLYSMDENIVSNWLPFDKRNHFISIGNFLA